MKTRSGRKKSAEAKSQPKPKSAPRKTQKRKAKGEEAEEPEKKQKQEEAPKQQSREHNEILEKGLIYFFYRPKVGVEHPHGLEDVQKLFVLLWPGAESIRKDEKEMENPQGKRGDEEPERLLIISKKTLPEISKHERTFGFVDKVSFRVKEVEDVLEAQEYSTKTRGERHVEGARPIGEGVYALVNHHGRTHLAYVLELPEEPTPIQQAFHIRKEGSYGLMVKNPEMGGSFLGERRAHFPPEAMKHFQGKRGPLRFTSAQPELLDCEGAELLFIGASEDLKAELGDAGEYLEELEKVDSQDISAEKFWEELRMSKAEHPPEPMLKGKWK